ncbi:MAG: RnfABCDGE type electron transport complex subunit D [Deltaproteobacteria bacterium]|jgi:electron transport complex protein RnfD|nr:RnfABCDGE type electron transport complex subunit D [Deltaproteobacteria bacterium]
MENKLYVSSSPHVHGGESTSRLMWTVVASLLPAAGVSVWLFGLPAVTVLVGTVLFCVLAEAAFQLAVKKPVSAADGSAVLTGLLLALTLPPGLPLWICAVGAVVAVVLAKGVFGGLGQNPFNPALTARVFLLIAFPGPLTRWLVPRGADEELFGSPVTALDAAGNAVEFGAANVDALTAATPLGLLSEQGAHAVAAMAGGSEIFFGQINGSLGETSAAALLLGGIFLLARKVISRHIPVSFLAAVAVFAAVSTGVDDSRYAGVLFHLFTGGVIIGAFFMATDYVTSPMFPLGKIIFGLGCGILTMVIRLWAGYPEGVSFAILLMNATVPLIDRYTRPRKFGARRLAAAEEGGQ